MIGPRVRARPGLRVPGTWDPFETGVRAIVGQQVSVAGASTVTARIVARHGEPITGDPVLTHRFPPAEVLADADLDGLGLTGARITAIRGFAAAVADGVDPARRLGVLEELVASVVAVRGLGPWTATTSPSAPATPTPSPSPTSACSGPPASTPAPSPPPPSDGARIAPSPRCCFGFADGRLRSAPVSRPWGPRSAPPPPAVPPARLAGRLRRVERRLTLRPAPAGHRPGRLLHVVAGGRALRVVWPRASGHCLVASCMCRNITELRGLEPPATAEEIEAAARQYIRKVSGLQKPPAAAVVAYEQAIVAVAEITTKLLEVVPPRRQPPPTLPPLRRPEVRARLGLS